MHKQSSRSEWANKPTKEVGKKKKIKGKKKKKSQGEMKENMKKKKEPNLMESMA